MKILLVADYEERSLWGNWTAEMAAKLSSVDIILSAGDLCTSYLEFLTDNLKVPVVYVPGNHDSYNSNSPKRCINADGMVIDLQLHKDNEENYVKIIGLGGSMRYKDGPHQYSEEEQQRRAEKVLKDLGSKNVKKERGINIFLTHAPCRGFGDMADLPHRGFDCFNDLIEKWKPKIHCYGHVHREYSAYDSQASKQSGFARMIEHPSGTYLINGYGHQFIQI